MGFSVMLWGAKKMVPVEYWCPYGTENGRALTLDIYFCFSLKPGWSFQYLVLFFKGALIIYEGIWFSNSVRSKIFIISNLNKH